MEQKYYVKTYSDNACYTYDLYYGVRNPVVSEEEFTNKMDALAAAKKTAKKTKEDVVIYKIDSVVKFPEPDLTVEDVV